MGGDVISLSVVGRSGALPIGGRRERETSIGVERLGSDRRRSAWGNTWAIFYATFIVEQTDTQERRLAD